MQNLAIVTDENPTEVKLRKSAQELIDSASSIVIFTRSDLSVATDIVKTIKSRHKEIEEERVRIVKPFNDGVKAINARFKAMTGPLEEAESELKQKMLVFQKEEERKAEEQRRIMEAELRKQEEEDRKRREEEDAKRIADGTDGEEQDRAPLPEPVIISPQPIISAFKATTYGQTGATSTMRKIWTHDLVDITKVPAEYLVLDTVKVNQAVRAGAREISGLRIYQKEDIQVR